MNNRLRRIISTIMYNLRYSCFYFFIFCVWDTKCLLYEARDGPNLDLGKRADVPSIGDTCYSEVDRINGTCIPVHRCLSILNALKKEFNRSDVYVNKWGLHFFKAGSKAGDKCVEHIATLNYPCYLYTGLIRTIDYWDKICYVFESPVVTTTGGLNAERGEFPHMALLGYGVSFRTAQWVCGGTVISDRFILTAAHCISSGKLGTVKYIGLGILRRSDPVDTWQIYNVSRIIPHPEYRSPAKYHDIALLQTKTEIKFNMYVLPACLDIRDSDESFALAAGWGALGYRKHLADNLQMIYVKEFSEEECSNAYPANRNLRHGYNHTTQSCYGDEDHVINTCQGDSGGPLFTESVHGSCVFNIIGVTSFGAACHILGVPGVYTRVSYYVPWIETIVWP